MSASISILGSALLALLLAGYVAQKYLPSPPPRVAGIDLGTTFSSIGVYHSATGDTEIIADKQGRKVIPSIVGFLKNGSVLIGYDALAQSEHNPLGTIYDAKRFIGKNFDSQDPVFLKDKKRYPFRVELDDEGRAYFLVPLEGKVDAQGAKEKVWRKTTPEQVGSYIISYLIKLALDSQDVNIKKAVISVPAEFNEKQRNATKMAANLAGGTDVYRIISEPTAAALAYGLHKKERVEHILVVDLGGGTLDVSLLWLQGGLFITRAMAGNNRLGGQDFNERILQRIISKILEDTGVKITDKEDIQNLRHAVESLKLKLTAVQKAGVTLKLASLDSKPYKFEMWRSEFENLNSDLFDSVLEPIRACLADAEVGIEDIDEIVLVGGSTRIPKVRQIVGEFFKMAPNYGVDPELAVVTGVAVQAGVLGGGWPLQVSAVELPVTLRKVHVYHETRDEMKEEENKK